MRDSRCLPAAPLALMSSGEAGQYICQEYVSPREEITVDCFVASSGEIICAVPRRRIAVAGGEVTDTVTIGDSDIEALSHNILRTLALRGPVTIQFLRRKNPDGTLGEPLLMEINPRLGGGAVCAVHAGADIPYFILADWLHKPLEPCSSWKSGVRIARYMQEVVFNE